jgi:hypothetical protein
MTNPTDAAIERHIWPDGDWHHETCRCGAAHPRDAGILARSTSTALEELDSACRRSNAATARVEAAERLVAAARDVIQQAQGMTVIEDNITGIIVDLDALATDLAAYDAIAQRDTPPGAGNQEGQV